ncbi:phosphatase and actin regulator 2 [Trichonephila clavipes]|nr:phosphatase and actin regulator 2 [Trichonephila clavipes]
MKTSSMNFNAASPMESKHRRFALLRKIFQPWQWKRRKKRNRFEQTSRTLQKKISMRSTKDQLVKKDVLMPVKHNVFLWNLPDVDESLSVPSFLYVSDSPLVSMKKEKREVPLRTAYSQDSRIIQIGNEIWKRHVDQIRKCGKSSELSQAATEIPIYDKEWNFPDEPVSDHVAESEPPAPVPEVVPKPKDVPVPATPSDDILPKPVPDASGKAKTDVPLRRSTRIRRPPKRLDL